MTLQWEGQPGQAALSSRRTQYWMDFPGRGEGVRAAGGKGRGSPGWVGTREQLISIEVWTVEKGTSRDLAKMVARG